MARSTHDLGLHSGLQQPDRMLAVVARESRMMLPFTREEFIGLFAQYNLAVWPVQILAYVLGIAMVASLWRPSRTADRLIAGGLAAMWLWTGIAYQWMHFAAINPAALGFGAMFVLQGVLFSVAAACGTTPR